MAAWLSNTARLIAREMVGNGTRRTARLANGFAPELPMSPGQGSERMSPVSMKDPFTNVFCLSIKKLYIHEMGGSRPRDKGL